MGAKESGQTFLAGVLAKLPEADRAAAQAIFGKPEAEAAVVLVGEGALARPDYSKHMDDLTKKTGELDARQTELNEWFAANEAALKEYLTIKPEYDKLKGTTPLVPKPPVAGLTKEEIDEQLEARDRSFAGALALSMNLASRHLHMFNEPLDTSELLANPKLGRPIDGQPGRVFGLQEAYDEKHGARVTAKHTDAETARINKMVDEKVAEKLKGVNSQHPFPLRDPNPSPLDALADTTRKTADYSVDSAIAEYERLQQTRSGAPA